MVDRIKFILNTSAEYFNLTATKDNTNTIDEFLKNDENTILAVTENNGKILFNQKIPGDDEICLLFYKIPKIVSRNGIGDKNFITNGITSLGMLTLEGGMVKSMYNSISRVFSPHSGLKNSEYSAEITGLLENLHVSLNQTLGLPQTGITNIQDEISFWDQKSINSSTKSDRDQAQAFALILGKLNHQINQIDQNSFGTIEEFLDSSHNNLDEIWRLSYHYPQNRMEDLMDIICNFIIDICVDNLLTENIWNLSSYHVNNLMSQAYDLTDSWIQLCDSLTRLFWKNNVQHPWIGSPHLPKRGVNFKERLSEIKNIKNLYKQIVTLLNGQDIKEMFAFSSPFKMINIFDTSSVGQMKWNKSLNQFEQMLQPIDERIALAIKSQLQNQLNNPRQVIFIFSKYDTLIQRPTVLELLTIEREQFLQSLNLLLQDLRKAMNDTNMEPDTGHLSTICNECRWLKVVQYQISEIEKVSHLISGRDGFNKLNQTVQELKEETDTLLRTNFEIWCEQNLLAVKSGELRLHEDQPVVKFEREGRQLMEVTFNPKLVTFYQDVREFENLNYRVPIELRSVAEHTLKFMSYARRLQQIATFHNTIGDRMIPCQRPIMLKNAMELSKLVKSESVAWNDEESVQRYVTTLQNSVSKLSNDNNTLVGYHEQAKRTVIKLMNTDLLSQGQLWKDEMRHLRELVANLERQGYTNLDAFNLHWDHQLYKVLEYQYISGLIDMNNKLPDIRIDIVFRQRQLQFRPSEEEIRSKYFIQLRRFIERPLGFRGLSAEKSNELFKIMVERNRHHFGPLFKKAEELFKRLEELKSLWIPWVALGCVDIDELCGVHLNKWEDWDTNFKACKYFSQQIAKLQSSEETIDCFVINFLPLRSDIEFINRRYWEGLASSLKLSILNDISIIQEFLQTSLQFLQNVPMDESSIAESGSRYEKIISQMPKISETLDIVKGKDTCLAGWCKERVSALSGILNQWEKLQPLIENHSVVLQRQVDIMKDHAKTQIINLTNEVEKFMLRWESTVVELENSECNNLDLFKERRENWKIIKSKMEKLQEDCIKLNVEYPEEANEAFISGEHTIMSQSKQWEIYDEFLTEFNNILKEEWTIYRRRPYILTEFLSKWESSVNSSLDMPSSRIRHSVQQCQDILPILQYLQSDALTERHWARIFQLLKMQPKPLHTILLKDVLVDNSVLEQSSNEIQNLVRKASSEQVIRQALGELDQWAVIAIFKLTIHNDSIGNQVTLIKDYQEILNKIGDNQSLLQSAKNSSSFDSFSDQAELWESRLNTLESLLTSLSQSQRKWIYLEPVFETGTLKNEEAIFKRLDKDFRYIMREIQSDSRVLSIIKINNITTIIRSLENQLSRCQNTLMSYIMEKRNLFPRFYFLGDDDLLELLGQASKEEIIQKHIRKLFPGIQTIGFIKSGINNTIENIQSAEGDLVKLKQSVIITNSVESWLNELIATIQKTLQEQIIQCCQLKIFDENHFRKYPIQVLSTSRSILFTKETEKCITSMTLATHLNKLKDEITKCSELKNQTDNNLLKLKYKSILLDLVHYKNIIDELIEKNVTNLHDWQWLQQMKFYLDQNSMLVKIKMIYGEFNYSYEFLGNPNKLVHTSLTHRCYLTLCQSMFMGLGGNPFGPAGTGKTECVKALGSMMGRLVLVFNCDENVDTDAMSLILTGLALCGAWGCFDEFNRLQESTLSAISMLIQPIQTALKEKSDNVQILEKIVKLNHHCGIFVTLNPAGNGYGGRQQLPGNIQALFRPIVMQQPEPKEIARILLFVEGFQNANEIGDRIVELFDMNTKVLSSERHYDWGLRELKTVLIACGQENLIERNLQNELKKVVQVLRANTMSKLTLIDSQRFDMLLKNVFPEIQIDEKPESYLMKSIDDAFVSMNLYKNDRQIEKVMQLNEQLTKRMGIVVVGPPQSGKTTIISLLRKALINSGKIIRTYTISPKSMNRIELLGKLDSDTRQWYDGVLTSTAVNVNSESLEITSWIICDGDVDPEWIESLNSVLDDNRLLTLPSGWRIQFGNNVNFIFETHDLSHASPATISRMGIINLSAEDLSPKLLIETFLKDEEYPDILRSYIDETFTNSLFEHLENYKSPLYHMKITILKSILQSISSIQIREEFYVNLVQSLLGFIPNENHNEFSNKIYEFNDIYISNPSKSELTYFNKNRSNIDFYQSDYTQIAGTELIPTSQIKLSLEILRKFLKNHKPFLIVGPSGCGKTILLENAIQENSGYQFVMINSSKQLTANYVLQILKQNSIIVSGLKGRECKPQQLKIILFLKNIDLCNIDGWGTSDVIELCLQLIQRCGFYSENLEWISISDLQICGSITNLLTTKEKLSSRFLAINNYLSINYPIEEDLQVIIKNHIQPVLMKFKNSPNIERIVDCLMRFFKETKEKFSSDHRIHYNFTPKTMVKMIQCLKNYNEDYFIEALLTEINAAFRNRLVTSKEFDEFMEILENNMRNFMSDKKNEIVFVCKTAQIASFVCVSIDEWTENIKKAITICNTETFQINGPITNELLDQTSSMTRIFSRPNSHLVVVSRPGNRAIDSIYIAATILSAKVLTPQGTKNYSILEFYNDLKMAMQTSALDDQNTIFLIDQCWTTFLPEILKPIEAILEGILDLFGDDLESVASPLKSVAQLEGYQDSLASYFLKRVKKNLHLVLSMDSLSEKLETNFENYPALYRNANHMWILRPSDETFHTLPKKFIDSFTNGKNEIPIPSYLSKALETIKHNYAPKRFYQLIQSYCTIYKNFEQETTEKLNRLRIGVEKLANAHQVVGELKANASGQEEALAEKRKLANDALEMISATMRNANDQKSDMLELKKNTQVSSIKLKERQQAIAEELSEVEPILREASAAVGQIKTEALAEIRSLRAPPETIRDILEGVLRLMGTRDTSWNSMKSFLAKRGVKEDIKSLDPSRISAENCEAVEKLLEIKSDSFDLRNAKRASVAAAPLAAWVIANVKYSKVIQSIKPLEQEQKRLQENLQIAENEIQSLMSGLDDVDARVKELSHQLNVYTQEAAVLEIKLDEASQTLKSAEILVQKLSSEYRTWSKQLEDYHQEYKTLDSKSFWISLIINYFSEQNLDHRKFLINILAKNVQSQENINIKNYLITEQDQVIWEGMGLSRDAQSVENAAILTKILELQFGSCPTPLILDPTDTAFKWLRDFLQSKEKSFEIITQNSEKISYSLELAVRFGKILIVQDCDEIYPPLLQLIFARIYSKFNKKLLQVGNKLVDLHDDFKLILFTKLNHIEIQPEIDSFLTRIHFTITASGLTDQLMSTLIILRKPELQERRLNLLKNEGKLLKERTDLEKKLLHELTNAQGDILKNDKLLKTLNEMKESGNHIDQSLKESSEIKNTLIQEYNQFQELCSNAANFFIGLNKSYDISVTAFAKLYMNTLNYCGDVEDEKIYKHLIKLTYQYICRSIAKDDYLTLGLTICKNAFPDQISIDEWEMFVTNFHPTDEEIQNISQPNWMKNEHRQKVQVLISRISNTNKHFQFDNEQLWTNYLNAKEFVIISLSISYFQKILISQIFRPDFMPLTINQMITSMIGIKPETITQPTIEQLANESTKSVPVLMVTEPGNDPSTEIKDFAIQKYGKENYMEILLGRGKEIETLEKIKNAAQSNKWICVKNVHLIPNMIQKIDRELTTMQIGENFRLWLICDSIKNFPESILYKYVRVLYESPNGIKNKIQRLLHQWDTNADGKYQNNAKLMKLHMIFFILNSVLQERRKYIPQGWSKYYEFGDADIRSGFEILKLFDKEFGTSKMDWIILRGLFDIIAYGGRINSPLDFKILQKHLEEFFNESVMNNRWSPLRLNIIVPTTNRPQDYYDILQKFSDVDRPEELGLSPSSNAFRNISFCKKILQTLRHSYYKEKDERKEHETVEKRIRPILGLWKKIASGTTIEQTANQIHTEKSLTPWQDFLISEMKTAAKIFNEIHGTLVQIHLSMKRTKSNSRSSSTIIAKLSENQVPVNWKSYWSGPKTAFDYLKAVVARGIETEKRYKNHFQLEFCNQIDLATIFNISTFFSALKLTNSIHLGKSSKNLIFNTRNTKVDKNSQVVVQIAPLNIDGATFVSGKLTVFDKSIKNHDKQQQSPEFYVTYIEKDNENIKMIHSTSELFVNLPLYSNISRDLFVCNFEVQSIDDYNTVLLSGSALYVANNI